MPIPFFIKTIIKKKDPSYNVLNLSNSMYDEDIEELVNLVNENPYIETICLRNISLKKGVIHLKMLPSTVTKLDLSSNNIDDESLKLFYPFISNVKELNLGWNNLTRLSVPSFFEDKTRTFLNVWGNGFNDAAQLISDSINKNKPQNTLPVETPFPEITEDEKRKMSLVD